jgi:hypothetical protein
MGDHAHHTHRQCLLEALETIGKNPTGDENQNLCKYVTILNNALEIFTIQFQFIIEF